MRTVVVVSLLVTLVAWTRAASADVVELKNGRSIEGKVIDRDDGVDVVVSLGKVHVRRQEVARIEYGPTSEERLVERLASIDPDDPAALRKAADEAGRAGLADRARELRAMARDRELEARLAKIDPDDAPGLLELARWARANGADIAVQRFLIERALRADPGNERARMALASLAAEERARQKQESSARTPVVVRTPSTGSVTVIPSTGSVTVAPIHHHHRVDLVTALREHRLLDLAHDRRDALRGAEHARHDAREGRHAMPVLSHPTPAHVRLATAGHPDRGGHPGGGSGGHGGGHPGGHSGSGGHGGGHGGHRH